MKKHSAIVSDRQKELCKVFDSLCGRQNRWTVWSDCMVMIATAISNRVDLAHAEEREQIYLDTIKKYNKAEMDGFVKMFALIVDGMEDDPDRDFLGELYMQLELGNKNNGQFFTPYCLCRLMAEMEDEISPQIDATGWAGVNDPACGAGALLVAYANVCRKRGINYQQSVLFVGQDLDFVTACMCYIQLSLMGCPGYVVVGDTLCNPCTTRDPRGLLPVDRGNIWYTPMFFSGIWTGRKLLARLRIADKQVQPKPEENEIPMEETDGGQLKLF